MKRASLLSFGRLAILLLLTHAAFLTSASAAGSTLIGWSELGMAESDGSDVSVYSLLPPYSTIHAQLISGGKLVTNTNGFTVTYEAVADSTGSINTTSQGKGNFYQYAQILFGTPLAPDQGLAGFAMPGPTNRPQAMAFDPIGNRFTATGLPLTPYDDQGRKNYYPMMRLTARDSAGHVLATTDIAVPVTDEMDCRSCHQSGSKPDARPFEGWVWDCNPDRDYKLNILRYHDEAHGGTSTYTNVLTAVGYNPAGLYVTVTQDAKPVLCSRCHESNALPGSGAPGMRPMTQLIHTKHAYVSDPDLGVALTTMNTSAACFRCHAGSQTQYLRGVHHNTVSSDGSLALQCQNCHGSLTDLGVAGRKGWLDEPNCQSCHTGTASRNNGQLRYTNILAAVGSVRQPVDQTFATQTNTPAAGLSLFRSSAGHGGLQCAACHGAAHAELPSSQTNDNAQSQALQQHVGSLLECSACHPTVPSTVNGGPHGMHPVGQTWISGHRRTGRSPTQCQVCHGTDYRGTVLSRMESDQVFNGNEDSGNQTFWRGFQIGCYNCHNGPSGEGEGFRSNIAAVANNNSVTTISTNPVTVTLQASDADGDTLTYRIVSQPAHGTASLNGNVATYFPAAGFFGSDTFTYSAWDGFTDSNLGNVTATVNPGNCTLTATATAPTAVFPNALAPFRATASLAQCVSTGFVYDWDFGDGSPHASGTNTCHTYSTVGDYTWKLTVTANGLSQTVNGIVTVSPTLGPPLPLSISASDFMILLSWPLDRIPVSLETSPDPSQPYSWQPVPDPPVVEATNVSLQVYVLPGQQYFRLRRVP
jgi:hypothetical protein